MSKSRIGTTSTSRFCGMLVLGTVLLYAISLRAEPAITPAIFDCLGGVDNVQRTRDNLEIVRAYLKRSKDNFGPGRAVAIEAAQEAIAEFERLYGEPRLAPTPGSEKTHSVGAHGHPRMQLALSVLRTLRSDLNTPLCMKNDRLDALRHDIAAAMDGIAQAFAFNPPFSGH